MKIALVDDEREYLDIMQILCHEYGKSRDCQVETTNFCGGEELIAELREKPPEFSIVFLDIYMPKMDGISIARALRDTDPGCIIIFLTSSREFMPEAFACHAFDYISKPIDRERLFRVLDDARRLLPSTDKLIELNSDRKTVRILLDDIVYALSDGHYLEIALINGSKLRQRMTAAEFLSRTGGDDRFFLANRGVILNVGHIQSFGEGCCIMEGGTTLPMRVKDARLVQQAVMNRSFESIRSRQRIENFEE